MIMKESQSPVKLSSDCTVSDYKSMEAIKDKEGIARFVEQRFTERYLDPVTVDKEKKNGFTIMAISCLMIEAIESFSCGWPNSKGKSKKAFSSFFSRWPQFNSFHPIANDFYEHIRCGILHQAETTGGWRILRKGPLIDGKTINASLFSKALHEVLLSYTQQLRTEPWESEVLENFRKKMDAVCRNAVAIT